MRISQAVVIETSGLLKGKTMIEEPGVLYVYQCEECGHKDVVHLSGDNHDGEQASCSACGGEVVLEWDDGIKFSVSSTRK